MVERPDPPSRAQLRRRAEQALRQARRKEDAARWLERLLGVAPDDSEDALFARRHLAELFLESNPWVAALHLRRVLAVQQDDDVGHALMGLCQALLGNFRSSVSAYRKALVVAPSNPWYHHNLGHLLDVALGAPASAVEHLSAAHRLEPMEDEITASLAHCLARLGRRDEALGLAREAVELAPHNDEHRSLLQWIEEDEGADVGTPSPKQRVRRSSREVATRARRRRKAPSGSRREAALAARDTPARGVLVEQRLERSMREAGFSPALVASARTLWADFRERSGVATGELDRMQKPEVFAAAVEYAIALVHGLDGVTQAAVARRYGVAATSLSLRYGQIREALALRPGDPRYGR